MWANIANFVSKNWIDILLVIVGASAFIIYWVQERRKISEAASLIVLQVEELQTSIAEVGSYISEGKLNDGAFYESQMLFKTDSVINQNALTHYIPVQIRITLENALKKYNAIQVIGCEGYRKLKKNANRKF